MNELQKVFNYGTAQVRTVLKNEDVWFVAKDVCEILDISNPSQAMNRLDSDEKNTIILNEGIGNPEKAIVSESGLYSLILGSRKKEAKQFKRWITHEVIPSIRKHGAYMTPETIEKAILNPDFIINLAGRLKDEQEQRQALEQKINRDEPYTNFGKAVSNSRASINVGAFAKMVYDEHGIRMGRNKMFDWLRGNGYLIKSGRERNNPKQQYIEQGLFDTTLTMVSRTQGDIENITTLITGKGQVYFTKKLKQEEIQTA